MRQSDTSTTNINTVPQDIKGKTIINESSKLAVNKMNALSAIVLVTLLINVPQ